MRTAALGDGATLLGRSEHPLRYDPMGDVGLDQPTATATSATSSRMARLIAVACATERSIPHSSDRRRSLLRGEYGSPAPGRKPAPQNVSTKPGNRRSVDRGTGTSGRNPLPPGNVRARWGAMSVAYRPDTLATFH